MRIHSNNNINIGILDGNEDVQDLLNINGYREAIKNEIFELESWNANDALNYLTGMLTVKFSEEPVPRLENVETLEGVDISWSSLGKLYFKELEKRVLWIRKLWDSGNHKDKNPINYYIEWAQEKNIDVPWLDYYKENFYEANATDDDHFPIKTRDNLLRVIGTLHEILLNFPIKTLQNSETIDSHAISANVNPDAPVFKSQADLIKFIKFKYDGIAGLSKRQLEDVFPDAKKALDN
jgi:hypothetical protein